LYRLFSQPLHRIKEYALFLERLGTACEVTDVRVSGQLSVIARMWRAIASDNMAGIELANVTASFWTEFPQVCWLICSATSFSLNKFIL
jgi:hypothetical protein